MTGTRPGSRYAEAVMKRFGLSQEHLIGLRFAIDVALATTIVWNVLQRIGETNPTWGIASMVAACDPQPEEARRIFKCRLANVVVGSACGLVFLLAGGTAPWILPLALASTVLVSTYIVRITTMWRQAPITAAVVIAAAISANSPAMGLTQGLHKVAEVVFGCLVGVTVGILMSKVWLIQPAPGQKTNA